MDRVQVENTHANRYTGNVCFPRLGEILACSEKWRWLKEKQRIFGELFNSIFVYTLAKGKQIAKNGNYPFIFYIPRFNP